ncbi:hypothetical protein Val02_86580 [Virgisporangium aliadipatigenens]|uniref:ABC transporter n=1 Tax=Virgisporangium aliadipatigenens TaxID=741659 RepID=A0A8J3YWG6_9ACTN|nr:hypothetical protein [Virgisporangium aliadipatigenens]GIJ51772.1 hypothetical protein Val02_86580 [Virgisporangium aliadipatigenens]
MTALVRYTLSMTVHGQAYLPPLILWASAVVVLTMNDLGPLTGSYAACAMTLFVCLTWLTAVQVNTESQTQRAMTAVAAGGLPRVFVAHVLAALVFSAALTAVGLVFPIVAGTHTVTAADVAIGATAQGICAVTGIAAGLLCSRPVVPRTGYAVVLALLLDGFLLIANAVPPVGPVVRGLNAGIPPGRLAGHAAVAVALLVLAVATASAVASRRD